MASSTSLPQALQSMKEEEDKLREQFASSSGSSSSSYSSYSYGSSSGGSIDDPHVHLIDVFSNLHTFTKQDLSAEERAIPQLFEQPETLATGSSVVANEATFKSNWDEFTSGCLKGLDWSNTFAAGGAVLRCLDLGGQVKEDESKGSDVDLFLYGLSDEQANEKIRSIFEAVQSNVASSGKAQSLEIVRTKNAVTIIGQYPTRHVQIILRMYRSPAEVLMGFDIDSCTTGYDGSRVWALPRCRRALTKRYNLVDLSRRSLTYEIRLFKYSKRGFRVLVPGYRSRDVDSGLYNDGRPLKEVSGLARLLLLDQRRTTTTPAPAVPQPRKPQVPGKAEDEDYILVFIPYGPRWFLHRTIQLLNFTDKSQFFARRENNSSDHSHVLVLGMDGIFTGKAPWCHCCRNSVPPSAPSGDKGDDFVRGPISWLRDNPGQQTDSNLLTGSFHPLSAGDWERDALKSFGGQKGVIPPRPVVVSSFPGKKAVAVCKKFPTKKAAKKVAAKPKMKKYPKQPSGGFGGGFGAAKTAPAPKTGFGGGFGATKPAAKSTFGGFGAAKTAPAPQTGFGGGFGGGGFGAAQPAAGGFGAAQPAVGGFGAPQPAAGFGSPATGFGAARPAAIGGFGVPQPAAGGFGATSSASPSAIQTHPQLEEQYKLAAPQETDTKLFLLLSLLKKVGLSPQDHSKLKDKVINGDANLVCALEVFEIDYDFDELADTLQLIAQL